jgi:hypothetical protein
MSVRIANTQFWVHDHDEALAFYVAKLGWEVRSDVSMPEWNFRWLTVGPAHQPDIALVLMKIPGPPMLDDSTAAQLAELVAKGMAGTLFLETDDCQAAFDEYRARGVETRRRPSPTGSTPRSATRQATTSGSPKCSSSTPPAASEPHHVRRAPLMVGHHVRR